MNILIAESSNRVRSQLRRYVEALGHTVVAEASTGEEAIELYQKMRPDFVALDVEILQVDSFTAITRIRQLNPAANVGLITSAIAIKQMLEAKKKMGASAFVLKPLKKEKVEEFIAQAQKAA